ncbi:hypothetical protein [Polaromonas sp. AER18D-145]|uniref:hypothetical protein n=1 Tax=Polaromonas sp. AER18D-145 TaxID=1977060 RepID=UPI00197B3267|nr:hypothetical protein [Polaromonas sp. AER18D-145]
MQTGATHLSATPEVNEGAELLDGRVLLDQAPAQFLGAPLRKPQFIFERPQAPHLFLDLMQIALGARQVAQQTRVVLKGVDGFLLLGGQGLVHGAQLGLQVLHLLIVLALVLVALLLGGLPEMLQRMARMLVLFFQGLAMAFFGRDALLQVGHLLRELGALKGLAAQRFAGFAVSGFFLGQRPLVSDENRLLGHRVSGGCADLP